MIDPQTDGVAPAELQPLGSDELAAPETPPHVPEINSRDSFSGPPKGMLRSDHQGLRTIDAMSGRIGPRGHGDPETLTMIQDVAAQGFGDALDVLHDLAATRQVQESLIQMPGLSDGVQPDVLLICPSADHAVEQAVAMARMNAHPQAGDSQRFRTIS
ncbi:MAG: hypothetical protein AAGA03_11715, partial [Planctomycetota bacterium]